MTNQEQPVQEKSLAVAVPSSRFIPANLEEAKKLASNLAASTIIPKDFQGNAANTLIAIMHGAELGLTPSQALSNIMVVNGRASMWGDAVIGKVQGSGLMVDWEDSWDEATGTATFTCYRRGKKTPVTRTFSLEDAKKAGLTGKIGPWSNYPKRMCFNRARAFALRDCFADVLKGIRITEEEQDVIIDVTPRAAASEEVKNIRAAFTEAPIAHQDPEPQQEANMVAAEAIAGESMNGAAPQPDQEPEPELPIDKPKPAAKAPAKAPPRNIFK